MVLYIFLLSTSTYISRQTHNLIKYHIQNENDGIIKYHHKNHGNQVSNDRCCNHTAYDMPTHNAHVVSSFRNDKKGVPVNHQNGKAVFAA